MRKLIKQYEEKNRIIEQIEKNLRMAHPKFTKPSPRHRQKAASQSFQIDLPTINVRHDYSPRSQNNSPNSKNLWQSPKQAIEELVEKEPNRKQSKAWIQTISFRNEGERPQHNQPVLLINHRITLRNFMKSAKKLQNSQNLFASIDPSKQIFLSPNKGAMSLTKSSNSKMYKTIRYNEDRQPFVFPSVENSRQNQPNIMAASNNNFHTYSTSSNQYSSQRQDGPVHQMMSTQIGSLTHRQDRNPQISNAENDQTVINSNMLSISQQNYHHRRGRRSNNNKGYRNKRSCSPWSSEHENEETNSIWEIKM